MSGYEDEERKKDKERKSGAAAGRWGGSEKPLGDTFTGARGASPGGGALPAAEAESAFSGGSRAYAGAWRTIGVGAAGRAGFWAGLARFLGANSGMVLLAAFTAALAAFSLHTLASGPQPSSRPAELLAFSSPAPAQALSRDDQRPVPSSLGFFTSPVRDVPLVQDGPPPKPEPPKEEARPAEAGAAAKQEAARDAVAAAVAGAASQGKPRLVLAAGFLNSPYVSAVHVAPPIGGGATLGSRTFDGSAARSLTPYQSAARRMTAGSARALLSARGKGAMGQLRFANNESRKALGMTADEGQSYRAAEAFSPGPAAGAGAGIAGGGLGVGGAGLGPSLSSSGLDTKSVSPSETPGGGAPSAGQGEDKSPWTAAVLLAMALLMAAGAIITIIGVLALMKDMPVIGEMLQGVMMALYVVATGLAAAATGLGAYVMTQHGQLEQGAILTTGGAITTACALASLAAPEAVSPWVSVLGGIAGIAAAVGAALAGMMK